MTGFESFVGIDPWTALFTFCNMMITFAVLKKFLFKPVKKMIDDIDHLFVGRGVRKVFNSIMDCNSIELDHEFKEKKIVIQLVCIFRGIE